MGTCSPCGISAIERISSVMRKAVGPIRVHTHLSQSGPSWVTHSVWIKMRKGLQFKKQQKLLINKNVPSHKNNVKSSYTLHLLSGHNERRARCNAVGTFWDGAWERTVAGLQRTGDLGLKEVFLEGSRVRSNWMVGLVFSIFFFKSVKPGHLTPEGLYSLKMVFFSQRLQCAQ